jgi:DNA-directed RNA polymerase specialized sigma24 family protein
MCPFAPFGAITVLVPPCGGIVNAMGGEDELEALVARAATGDELAWQEMWRDIEPWLARIVAQPRFLGRLGQREDDRSNIIVEVMARLRAEGFLRLGLYLQARRDNPQLRFRTWLRVVAKRVGIDYLRGHPDYVDRRRHANASAPGAWIEPGTLPSQSKLPGERPPVTNRGTAQQLLRYAAGAIPDDQRRALELWVQSESYDEIAREMSLDSAPAAEHLVRAAIERLRRRFRDRGGEGE